MPSIFGNNYNDGRPYGGEAGQSRHQDEYPEYPAEPDMMNTMPDHRALPAGQNESGPVDHEEQPVYRNIQTKSRFKVVKVIAGLAFLAGTGYLMFDTVHDGLEAKAQRDAAMQGYSATQSPGVIIMGQTPSPAAAPTPTPEAAPEPAPTPTPTPTESPSPEPSPSPSPSPVPSPTPKQSPVPDYWPKPTSHYLTPNVWCSLNVAEYTVTEEDKIGNTYSPFKAMQRIIHPKDFDYRQMGNAEWIAIQKLNHVDQDPPALGDGGVVPTDCHFVQH